MEESGGRIVGRVVANIKHSTYVFLLRGGLLIFAQENTRRGLRECLDGPGEKISGPTRQT